MCVAGEQRSRLSGEEAAAAGGADEAAGEEGYLDAKQRGLDDAAERRLVQIMRDYQHEINNYETLQKGERDRHPNDPRLSGTVLVVGLFPCNRLLVFTVLQE